MTTHRTAHKTIYETTDQHTASSLKQMTKRPWRPSVLTTATGWAAASGLTLLLAFGTSTTHADFDNNDWDQLLDDHVSMTRGGKSSQVDYAGMQRDQAKLAAYLDRTSNISRAQFDRWSKDEQLAFLINVYNARTVELVLSKYPKIKSIKDIGSLFSSPWKQKFIPLLGKTRSLDDVEHTLIRGSGRYNDARIHFAVNCASIGCPALQDDAFTADQLDQQLNQATAAFLSDRTRNRIRGNRLMVTPLFKWYAEDFESGWRGVDSVNDFLGKYSKSLGLSAAQKKALAANTLKISYTDYDWSLNKK